MPQTYCHCPPLPTYGHLILLQTGLGPTTPTLNHGDLPRPSCTTYPVILFAFLEGRRREEGGTYSSWTEHSHYMPWFPPRRLPMHTLLVSLPLPLPLIPHYGILTSFSFVQTWFFCGTFVVLELVLKFLKDTQFILVSLGGFFTTYYYSLFCIVPLAYCTPPSTLCTSCQCHLNIPSPYYTWTWFLVDSCIHYPVTDLYCLVYLVILQFTTTFDCCWFMDSPHHW